jgi:hypothetical protein
MFEEDILNKVKCGVEKLRECGKSLRRLCHKQEKEEDSGSYSKEVDMFLICKHLASEVSFIVKLYQSEESVKKFAGIWTPYPVVLAPTHL